MACVGRIVLDDEIGAIPFVNGGSFYLEFRCGKRCAGDLCEECVEREAKTPSVSGEQKKYLHGRISDPIPSWSRIFGGPWYTEQLKNGKKVSPVAMVRGKKAQKEVRDGTIMSYVTNKPIGELFKETPAVAPAPAPAAPVAAPAPAPAPAPTPAPAKAPRQRKKVAPQPAQQAAAPVPEGLPLAVVAAVPPIEPEEVVEIHVKPHTIGSTLYYLDTNKQKLYTKAFKYVGRWNAKEDAIDSSFPDSDAEQ